MFDILLHIHEHLLSILENSIILSDAAGGCFRGDKTRIFRSFGMLKNPLTQKVIQNSWQSWIKKSAFVDPISALQREIIHQMQLFSSNLRVFSRISLDASDIRINLIWDDDGSGFLTLFSPRQKKIFFRLQQRPFSTHFGLGTSCVNAKHF